MSDAASGSGTPWRLRVHESLPSTSDLLTTLAAAGEPEGLAVLARRQTAGRGRQGREWQSESGNLHLSVLLRPRTPPRLLPQWSLLAAVALLDALREFLPADEAQQRRLGLKWPNDVMLDGAKCAGILLDAGTQDGQGWLVIGFGANLTHAPEVSGRSTVHLAAAGIAPPSPESVAARLLDALARWRQVQLLKDFSAIRAAWLQRGPALGTPLTLRAGAGAPLLGGRFEGLAEDGGLLLASGGRVHALTAGEILG